VSAVPRLFLAVLLAAIIQPASTDIAFAVGPLLLLRELFVGVALALPCRFAAEVSEMLGELLDTARGQSVSSILDPINGQLFSDLSAVLRSAVIAGVVLCGGLRAGCLALRESYTVIPVFQRDNGAINGLSELLLETLPHILLLGSEVLLVTGVWLGAFMIIDLLAGLCARVCPGLSFATLSHSLKFLAVVFMAAVALEWSVESAITTAARVFSLPVEVGRGTALGRS
jgi:flagellar biosynthesis protein FliR